jgi:hypothetical protein
MFPAQLGPISERNNSGNSLGPTLFFMGRPRFHLFGTETSSEQAHIFRQQSGTARVFFEFGKSFSAQFPRARKQQIACRIQDFFTPPNALRLQWNSAANGGWEAQIDVVRFRNRQILVDVDALYFWCFSAEATPA